MRGDSILSSVPEPQNTKNTITQSSEGGNVVPPTNSIPETPIPSETRVFKNPTTIDELKDMRTQLQKDKNLKRRVKIEYRKKVQVEAQGQTYQPPEDLKQFKILQPRNLSNNPSQLTSAEGNDTSTKDISDQVFVGEETKKK